MKPVPLVLLLVLLTSHLPPAACRPSSLPGSRSRSDEALLLLLLLPAAVGDDAVSYLLDENILRLLQRNNPQIRSLNEVSSFPSLNDGNVAITTTRREAGALAHLARDLASLATEEEESAPPRGWRGEGERGGNSLEESEARRRGEGQRGGNSLEESASPRRGEGERGGNSLEERGPWRRGEGERGGNSLEVNKRNDDPQISIDLTFHLLRNMIEMAKIESQKEQAQINRKFLDEIGK